MGLLTACSPSILLEDGDGGGSNEGAATSTGGTSGNNGGQTGGGTSGNNGGQPGAGGGAIDAVAGCTKACDGPCIGNETLCLENCLTQAKPHCEAEAIAYQTCLSNQCPETPEGCFEAEGTLFGCYNPFDCGFESFDECESTNNSCSCNGACDEGHVALAECTWSDLDEYATCDCTFDGMVMGTCIEQHSYNRCSVYSGCCAGWFTVL